MNKLNLIFVAFVLTNWDLVGQFNYKIKIDSSRIHELMRLHSFAYGRLGDTIYVFGGRKDGVHNKAGGFELKGANRELILYDIRRNLAQNFSLQSLDITMLDPLCSSNSCFTQKSGKLYVAGGYSENSENKFVTFPSLLIVDLNQLRDLIISGNTAELVKCFKQIRNDTFAVAGGQLKYINKHFYLVGGHKFSGVYNAQTTAFQQTYTESAYVFDILNEEFSPTLQVLQQIRDELNFHRRDFNLGPFVTQKNKLELMSFSGVFLVNINSPYFNLASIQENGYTDIGNFNQWLANYQCGRTGFYSTSKDQMHEIFFGGMAVNYYDDLNQMVNDPFVPFVKTISCVERNEKGEYREFAFTEKMPGFLGTNSEFILNSNIPLYHDEIIDSDKLSGDSIEIGNLIGGIYNYSSRLNPWQDSMVQLTSTNPYILKVTLIRSDANQVKNNTKSNRYNIKHSTVLTDKNLNIQIEPRVNSLYYWIISSDGRICLQSKIDNNSEVLINTSSLLKGSYRFVMLLDNNYMYNFNFVNP